MREERGIGTYPVGLLADIKHRKVRHGLRYVVRQAKAGNWRAARNHFNGYLAEWHYPPDGLVQRRCGRGWTRRAARRRLGRHLVSGNLSVQEASR